MKSTDAGACALTAERPWPSRFELAQEIRDFLVEFDMKPTPFGIAAAKDDKLLWRIENAPNGISLDKADRIRAYMVEHRRTAYAAQPKPKALPERKPGVWHPGMIYEADEDGGKPRNRKQKASAS